MPLKPETHAIQSKLAQFCRTNSFEEIPGVREDRVGTYRRLVFNAVKGALENAYPITKKILGDEIWLDLVQDFFVHHNAKSFQLWHFPKELIEYARQRDLSSRLNLPFLDDLLLFEWIEIEVYMMKDRAFPSFTAEGDPLESELVVNPHFQIVPLQYPVFATTDTEKLQEPSQYFLLACRDIQSNKVRFSELSPLAVCVLQLLEEEPLCERDVLEASATHLSLSTDREFFVKGSELLEGLIKDAVILGYCE